MIRLEVGGTPEHMGACHGEALREHIQRLAAVRMERAVAAAGGDRERVELVGRQLVLSMETQLPSVAREFAGIAQGARLSPVETLVAGAVTDVTDVVNSETVAMGECTTIVCGSGSAARRPLLVGTWDSHPEAQESLTLIRRRPDNAPEAVGLTSCGTPIQQGLNEAGVAFAINNLKPRQARVGVVYTAALAQLAHAEAVPSGRSALGRLQFASGHYYCAVDCDGYLLGVETTCDETFDVLPASEVIAHTNHYVGGAPDAIDYAETQPRYRAARAFLSCWDGFEATAWSFLRQQAGSGAICRDDVTTRTCAAFVLDPVARTMQFTAGPPCTEPIQSESL
jgi:hypothetical protein